MGEFGGNEKWNENPFVFFAEGELINQGMEKLSPPNPIRAIYENLAPMIIRSPPAKRYPQEPSGTASFNILTDPLSALMPTSAVPDPIIGLTTQRTMRPTVQGKEGMATHLNIVVDTSGSMSGPESGGGVCYGYSPQGFGLGGEDIAMIVVAMMVGQASLSGDTFAIYSYNRGAKIVWEGPSQDYSACMDYLLAAWSPNDPNRPFAADGGTDIGAGLNLLGQTMSGYDFDQSVTVVIGDGSYDTVGSVRAEIFANYEYTDREIREMGPLFYVIIGADNDTLRIQAETAVRNFKTALTEEYGQPMDGCVLGFNILVGEGGTFANFAGTLVDMARVNSGDSDITPCPRV